MDRAHRRSDQRRVRRSGLSCSRATLEFRLALLPRCQPAVQAFALMERAVRLFTNNKFSRDLFGDDDLARATWATAVGKAINAHTSRVKLVRSTLVVEVEDAIWQKQLHFLTAQILARLHKLSGSNAIKDIEFRIGIPRREPHRAESRTTAVDEADSIQDPVLKKIYRVSRNKATA